MSLDQDSGSYATVVVIDVIVVSLIDAFYRAGSAWATMVAHMVEMGDTPTGGFVT